MPIDTPCAGIGILNTEAINSIGVLEVTDLPSSIISCEIINLECITQIDEVCTFLVYHILREEAQRIGDSRLVDCHLSLVNYTIHIVYRSLGDPHRSI